MKTGRRLQHTNVIFCPLWVNMGSVLKIMFQIALREQTDLVDIPKKYLIYLCLSDLCFQFVPTGYYTFSTSFCTPTKNVPMFQKREKLKISECEQKPNIIKLSLFYLWSWRRAERREGGRRSGLRLRQSPGPHALVFILPFWPLTFQLPCYLKNRTQPETAHDIQRGRGWSNMVANGQWKGTYYFNEKKNKYNVISGVVKTWMWMCRKCSPNWQEFCDLCRFLEQNFGSLFHIIININELIKLSSHGAFVKFPPLC